jgi:hypothetical protein
MGMGGRKLKGSMVERTFTGFFAAFSRCSDLLRMTGLLNGDWWEKAEGTDGGADIRGVLRCVLALLGLAQNDGALEWEWVGES